MKKVVLAIFLLSLVVAVSYLKDQRRSEREQEARMISEADKRQAVADYARKLDSLEVFASAQQVDFDRAAAMNDSIYNLERDSLFAIVAKERSDNDKLRASLSDRKKAGARSSGGTKVSSEAIASQHLKILQYYKKRHADLPSDLSTYEIGVARREIREESVQKFLITYRTLDRIRKKNNLDY